MNKQKYLIIFIVLFLGLSFSIYQYLETFKTEVASATSTVPNPGHLWSSMECNSDTLCVDTTNNRLGIGTAAPAGLLHLKGTDGDTALRIEANGQAAGGGPRVELKPYSAANVKTAIVARNTEHAYAKTDLYFVLDSADDTNSYAIDSTDTKMVIKNNGYVGIGTTTPGAKLDIKGSTETWEGMSKIFLTDSNSNANSRNWMMGNGGADYGSLVFRVSTAKDGDPATAGIFGLVIDKNGYVGIGTASPNYNLTVAGTAWVTSGSWSGSDARWKKNVSTLSTSSSLDKIMALTPVTYEWKTDEFPDMKFTTGTQLGFIAQDVENIIPEVVTTDNNGYKGISYEKIVPVLTSAIQEQQKEIESLKTMVCLDHPSADICK